MQLSSLFRKEVVPLVDKVISLLGSLCFEVVKSLIVETVLDKMKKNKKSRKPRRKRRKKR